MTQDEIMEMARQTGFERLGHTDNDWVCYPEDIKAFANLVAAKATEEANARANASWTLMCKKMVALEKEACAELVWPKLKIWTEEEQTAMGLAFNQAQEKHGWYETLMAVGATVLKMKAAAIRARGEQA